MRKSDMPGETIPTSFQTSQPPRQRQGRRRKRFVPLLIASSIALVAALMVLSSTGLNLLLPATSAADQVHAQPQSTPRSHARASPTPTPAPANMVVGQVYFSSSGQTTANSSYGIADELDISLSNIPAPLAGKGYYAWLINDTSTEGSALLLGQLMVSQGAVRFHYGGDQQHRDLLGAADRLLITEENTTPPPIVPTLDTGMWRYVAAFSLTPNPSNTVPHYSEMDHLRHLLAADTALDKMGLPGGLNIWLFRDMQQIYAWAGSARDNWAAQNSELIRTQVIDILDYLDGPTFVQQDVPPGTPLLADPRIAAAPLLEFDTLRQQPPGLLYHIGLHLQGLIESPGATRQQQQLAVQIDNALGQVQILLQQVRRDARQLAAMSDTQLTQPQALSLLNDLDNQAQNAFVGQLAEATGTIQGGVTQIYYAILRLATLDVTAITVNGQGCPCG